MRTIHLNQKLNILLTHYVTTLHSHPHPTRPTHTPTHNPTLPGQHTTPASQPHTHPHPPSPTHTVHFPPQCKCAGLALEFVKGQVSPGEPCSPAEHCTPRGLLPTCARFRLMLPGTPVSMPGSHLCTDHGQTPNSQQRHVHARAYTCTHVLTLGTVQMCLNMSAP